MDQQIKYCTAPDGVRLAYSIIGKGPTIVRTPHWFAHLEYDLSSPVYRHSVLTLVHQLSEPCGDIAVLSSIERRPKHDKQGTFPIAPHPQ